MATTSCTFCIKFLIYIAATYGLSILFMDFRPGNNVFSIVLAGIICSPILFVDYIFRFILRKENKQPKIKIDRTEIICPRCNIIIKREPGICPQCRIKP